MHYRYRQIKEVDCTLPEIADTLFVTSASFEERCAWSTDRISPGYKAADFVIVRYRGTEHSALVRARNLNFDHMYSRLSERAGKCGGGIEVVDCDREDPLDGYSALLEILERSSDREEPPVVTLDMSTLTKQYILVFLKALYENKVRLRVLYTSAQNYQRQLTWGVKSIVSVPFYNGAQLSRNGSVLVVFLGYERDRSLAIWKSCEPSKTVAVVCRQENGKADSPTQAERLNKHFLEISQAEVMQVDRFNINETVGILERLCSRYPADKYNLVASPLSTKVQALGLGMFFQEAMRTIGYSPLSIQYSLPFDYAKEYSAGSLCLWEFDVGLLRCDDKGGGS